MRKIDLSDTAVKWALWIAMTLAISAVLPASGLLPRKNGPKSNEVKVYSNYSVVNSRPQTHDALTPNPTPKKIETFTDDDSYISDTIQIEIEQVERKDLVFHVANIKLTSPSQLLTGFAQGKFGKSYRANTSKIAKDVDALLAINGDFYGYRNDGIIIRNGVLYRNKPANRDMLLIDSEGNFSIENEKDFNRESEVGATIMNSLSFGPALVVDGKAAKLDKKYIVSTRAHEPRTSIGQKGPLEYVIICVDGRSDKSDGMTLTDLAKEFIDRGCTVAYNLDGGGSTTMTFKDKVINNVSGSGERSISDIIYFLP